MRTAKPKKSTLRQKTVVKTEVDAIGLMADLFSEYGECGEEEEDNKPLIKRVRFNENKLPSWSATRASGGTIKRKKYVQEKWQKTIIESTKHPTSTSTPTSPPTRDTKSPVSLPR